MSLEALLMLKLNKELKGIKVTYNTFEKASFDQYLSASIALRTDNEQEAHDYIDDITGAGSLNAHLKSMYAKSSKLSADQLEAVMSNSMYPVLKIDTSNKYDYYPELNVSVFHNKVYEGDLGTYDNLIELLYIREKVIDCSVNTIKQFDRPDPYTVAFDNDTIKVKLIGKWVEMSSDLFASAYTNQLNTLYKYQGTIHKGVDGTGWRTLTNSTIGNMFSSNNYYYDEKGDHCLIREDGVRKTILSQIYDLYIYREENLPYQGRRDVCEKALKILRENNSINEVKTRSLVTILRNCDDLSAQDTINYVLARKDSKELAQLGLILLANGLEKNWTASSHLAFLKFAETSQFNIVYKANPTFNYTIDQLLAINPDLLTSEHKQRVDAYNLDVDNKRHQYITIIGEVTTSSLRENVKKLKSTADTKRFTKLANELIGHSKINIENASPKQVEELLKKAVEMKELAEKLSKALDEQDT